MDSRAILRMDIRCCSTVEKFGTIIGAILRMDIRFRKYAMNSGAMLRMDMGAYIGITLWVL